MTQQSSALVEENAATAKTPELQARTTDERVTFLRFDEVATLDGAPTAAALPEPEQKPALLRAARAVA